jgi:hypothetical protein
VEHYFIFTIFLFDTLFGRKSVGWTARCFAIIQQIQFILRPASKKFVPPCPSTEPSLHRPTFAGISLRYNKYSLQCCEIQSYKMKQKLFIYKGGPRLTRTFIFSFLFIYFFLLQKEYSSKIAFLFKVFFLYTNTFFPLSWKVTEASRMKGFIPTA